MIEPTDEMVQAVEQVEGLDYVHPDLARRIAAAVLAIVKRDLGMVGPCSASLTHLFDTEIATFCELRHGHSGDHESGPTRWRELP